MLQNSTELPVQFGRLLLITQSLAIGRIADDQTGMPAFGRADGIDLPAFDMDPALQAGALDMFQRGIDCLPALVEAGDHRQFFQTGCLSLFGLPEQFLPAVGVMLAPAEKPVIVTQQAGSIVRGNHCPLQQQRARAAHRVQQRAIALGDCRPVAAQQQRGGQVFLDRSGHPRGSVAALVQAGSGKIQAQLGAAALQIKIDADVGAFQVDIGALLKFVAHLVDDGILDFQGPEMAVADGGAVLYAAADRKAAVRVEMLRPVDVPDFPVKVFLGIDAEALQHQQNPVGAAAPQAEAIGGLQRAGKGRAGNGGLDVFRSQILEFPDQQRFHRFRRRGEQLAGGHYGRQKSPVAVTRL